MMSSRPKYICVHGHFYQPPRENAWLEHIQVQKSAYPFHDWNERINSECYAPNTAARIEENGYITKIINNYAKISFNIGPTLLSWLEEADPRTYNLIIEADKISQKQFEGHGSAIAQAYSHLILPLANPRDQFTQVHWGIKDFEHRFGRKPEGMWLAETATDVASLEALAAQGIKFTLLAPQQAKKWRKIGEEQWHDIQHNDFDTRRPYKCKLPSGKEIALFFYHGEVSQAVAFEKLLNDGRHFAHRIADGLSNDNQPQLMHIATDGESYGHHHYLGEMALAYALDYIERSELATLTNYGAYLEKYPPTFEMQIHENSSWSCVHGVERWRSDCGCHTGGQPGWRQHWRAPLRAALDWLSGELARIAEQVGAPLLHDVWAARNSYIDVILHRKTEITDAFLAQHCKTTPTQAVAVKVLRLMEMQRNAMLMYTSCGWFFNEVSGLETNQILQYANRAIQYAKQISGEDLHPTFLEYLDRTPSNVYESAGESYRKFVLPSVIGLEKAGMHFAAAALFTDTPEKIELYNYISTTDDFERLKQGKQRLVVGQSNMRSCITRSNKKFSFLAVSFGQQHIIGSIARDMNKKTFRKMSKEVKEAFQRGNAGQVLVIMDAYFGGVKYTIDNLFLDEKYRILHRIARHNMQQAEQEFLHTYENNYQLIETMKQNELPIPHTWLDAAEHVLNQELLQLFQLPELDLTMLQSLHDEFKKWEVEIRQLNVLKLTISDRIFNEINTVDTSASGEEKLYHINELLHLLLSLNIPLDFWKSQNAYYRMAQQMHLPNAPTPATTWIAAFAKLGDILKVKTPFSA